MLAVPTFPMLHLAGVGGYELVEGLRRRESIVEIGDQVLDYCPGALAAVLAIAAFIAVKLLPQLARRSFNPSFGLDLRAYAKPLQAAEVSQAGRGN